MSAKEQSSKARNSALKEFYHVKASGEMAGNDSYNLNSPHFNPDMFLHQLIKDFSLTDLMDTEASIYKQIQSLDSEMQTLVYENYNKFISATDTIRKMKVDFKKMEDEMELLAANMKHITAFSGAVSDTLQDRRDEINKLSSTHVMLKKLQFLFELPAQLKDAIEKENYRQAVEYHRQSQRVLEQYECRWPAAASLDGLRAECADSIAQLVAALQARLQHHQTSTEQLSEAVQLLLQLNEPPAGLCQRVIAHAQKKLAADLQVLTSQVEMMQNMETEGHPLEGLQAPQDVLEFVDVGCSNFLSNLSLFVTSYRDLFLGENSASAADAEARLGEFVREQMALLLAAAEARLSLEPASGSAAVLARALDRLHRRLVAGASILPEGETFVRSGLAVIAAAARRRCEQSLTLLEAHLQQCIAAVRQSLVVAAAAAAPAEASPLAEQLATFIGSLAERIRTLVTSLQAFTQPELSFGVQSRFRETFCRQHVRETVVVGFFRHFAATCRRFCDVAAGEKTSPSVILLLSRACRDLETSTVHYLMNFVDDLLRIEDKSDLTPLSSINDEVREVGQLLINHYVRVQGLSVSQMLRKSVAARDWQLSHEPRSVRSVMKRVVEELAAVDAQVGTLYEEEARWDQPNSSDSSRRTFHGGGGRPQRHDWSSYTPSQVDSGLVANIQKLFSERIEIFAPVEFSKVSILTGIIKISLKTLLECVRLKTFSKFGLQQVQVDVYYLQVNLWRFVADEKLLHGLLDEVLGSAIHRCLEPVLMEFSVIEVMCERG